MPLPEPIVRLLSAARRRLLGMRLTSWLLMAVAVAGFLGAGLVGVARFVVIPWAESFAFWTLGIGVVAGLAVAAITAPDRRRAAMELDRRLGGFDRVTTALELAERSPLTTRERQQITAAGVWASARRLEGFGKLLPARPVPQLAVVGLAGLLVAALVPAATDAAVAARLADRQAIDAAADRIQGQAEVVDPEVADELEAIAERLREADTLEAAISELGEARRSLTESLDPAELARRTALAGMEQRLARDPVAAGASAAEQLERLSEEIESGSSPQDSEQIASELAARAEDFAGVDQALSEALSSAAERLAAGDGLGTDSAEALRRAADELRRSDREAAAAEDREQAGAAVRREQEGLAERRDDPSQGEGQGQGQGQGEGQGQGRGQGQGQGQGPRSGPGPGRGPRPRAGTGTRPGAGTGSRPRWSRRWPGSRRSAGNRSRDRRNRFGSSTTWYRRR